LQLWKNFDAAAAADDDDYDDVDMSMAWESRRGNTKALATECQGYYELKQHTPWLDEEYSKLIHERKHDKLQWWQKEQCRTCN
jgi:hypothetical protein